MVSSAVGNSLPKRLRWHSRLFDADSKSAPAAKYLPLPVNIKSLLPSSYVCELSAAGFPIDSCANGIGGIRSIESHFGDATGLIKPRDYLLICHYLLGKSN